MKIHYNETTGEITGYTTFGKTKEVFIEEDTELRDELLTDYVVDLDDLTLVKKDQVGIDARIADELLTEAKTVKLREIEADYVLAESQAVTYLTFDFNGGEESATSIDKYIRLNRLGGAASHTVWDITNVDRTLTDAEADELLLAIGGASSVNKFDRKNRRKDVADLLLSDHDSLDEALAAIEAI